jgi:acetate---CoA ligase (ADP-forming)
MIEKIFNPKSVAVIGANNRENSVGFSIVENLSNKERKLYFVNPLQEFVFQEKTYPNIKEIEGDVDLAVIAIPKEHVLQAVRDCIDKKVGGVIIISSGFAEVDEEGRKKQQLIAKELALADISLVGPNCLGVLRPPYKLNASFAPTSPKEGKIAFISQSGGFIDAVIDGLFSQNYGFSLIVSVGNAAGLKITDYIKFADNDENTEVIALYIEGVENGRELFDTVKSAKKPIIFIKAGKVEKSLLVISSHTGSLAGEYRVFSSILNQAGAVEVDSLEEMFDVAKALSWQKRKKGSIGIVTNGGGAGVLLTDLIHINKLNLAVTKTPNPHDILGDASSEKYREALKEMFEEEDVACLVVIQTPQKVTKPMENAKVITDLKKVYQKNVVTIFMGDGEDTKNAVKHLEENDIPNYNDPKRALKTILTYTKNE